MSIVFFNYSGVRVAQVLGNHEQGHGHGRQRGVGRDYEVHEGRRQTER